MTLTILATNPNADLYGASRMVLESVRGFSSQGWRVVVTSPTGGPLADAARVAGAEFHLCPTPVLRKADLSAPGLLRLVWRTVRSIPPAIRLLQQLRPDVVYVNTITLPLWLVLTRVMRIPSLCHVHEGESEGSTALRRLILLPLLAASQLVVNSRFSRQVITDLAPHLSSRSDVLYNGVAGPPSVTPSRATLEPPLRLLYVGRLSERKGVSDALEATALLIGRGLGCELRVVGSAAPGYEHIERDLRARSAALASSVCWYGFEPDVWPHLAWADILLVPSRVDEPFGNTAVEGVLAGRPVVATRAGGLVEALEAVGSAALVPPGEPEALAAAVEDLVARWAEVRAASAADAARATRRFAPSVYRSLLCQRVRGLAT